MLKNKLGLIATLGFCWIFFGMNVNGQSTAEANIYNLDIEPLTVSECGQCHFSHFTRLKENGDKHQDVTCTDCHEKFHAYNPLKNNYAEIMPKCDQCHESGFHGTAPEVNACINCHQDPHQPLNAMPDPDGLESLCRSCHTDINGLLQGQPSRHTDETCSSCHSEKHGRIPACSECHENHSPMVVMEAPGCMECHPVHTPTNIVYPVTQNNQLCAGCHETPFNELRDNETKHTFLTCAKCHPSHAQLMTCQECHGDAPHNPSMHAKHPVCGDCHNTAHDIHK